MDEIVTNFVQIISFLTDSSDQNRMVAELKHALSLFQNRNTLEIKRTPAVYIDSEASPSEVQLWLHEKAFDSR